MLHRADLRRVDKRREPLPAGKVYHHHVWRGYQYDLYSRCICCGYSCRFGSGWYYSRIKAWRLTPPRRVTPARNAGREAGKPRVKAVCGTFYEELCKVENGITFPSMALDLALDTGKGLEPQGKSRHYRWQMPRKIRFWRITSWQKKK